MNTRAKLQAALSSAFRTKRRRSCDDDDEEGGLGLEELLGGAAFNQFSISNQNYMANRFLLLTGPITGVMFNEFRQAMAELNAASDEPVYVEVDSPGGDSFAMLGIMNTILMSKAPVDTFCQSKAHSAGAWIYLAGRRRFAPEGGLVSFLFHPARWSMSGVQGEYESMAGAMRKMADLLSAQYAGRTSLTPEQTRSFTTMDETYFMGQELFDLNICTDVLKENDLLGRFAAAEKAKMDPVARLEALDAERPRRGRKAKPTTEKSPAISTVD